MSELQCLLRDIWLDHLCQKGLEPELALATDGYAYRQEEFRLFYRNTDWTWMWKQALRRTILVRIIFENKLLSASIYQALGDRSLRNHRDHRYGSAVRYLHELPAMCHLIPPQLWPWEPILVHWQLATPLRHFWFQGIGLICDHLHLIDFEDHLADRMVPRLAFAYRWRHGHPSAGLITGIAKRTRHAALSNKVRECEGLLSLLEIRKERLYVDGSLGIGTCPRANGYTFSTHPHYVLADRFPRLWCIEHNSDFEEMIQDFPWELDSLESGADTDSDIDYLTAAGNENT